MRLTKDHVYAAGLVASMALGSASLLRSPTASIVTAVGSASPLPSAGAPAVSRCKEACTALAQWCIAGDAVNCVDLLTRYEREGVVTCSDGMSPQELEVIGWCPNGGKASWVRP